MSLNVPETVIYMVTDVVLDHNVISVSALDGGKCINGEKDMCLDKVKEKMTPGKPVIKGRFSHKAIPYGGDLVEVEYYFTKDNDYVGIDWKWANQVAPTSSSSS